MSNPTTKSGAKKRNPEAVKANILTVATEEFATSGYAGARVNVIAERTATSKRMIYYYFTDKETLYREVLANAYLNIRFGEKDLRLDDYSPIEALKVLTEFTFKHQAANLNFIRLVMIENIHQGKHLVAQKEFQKINAPAIDRLETLYQRGLDEGVFRENLTGLEIHWLISSMAFFNVSNKTTFSAAFGNDLYTKSGQELLCENVQDVVLRFVSV